MDGHRSGDDPAWLNTHSHDPNPVAPDGDGRFRLHTAGGSQTITLKILRTLHYVEIPGCVIVSTGHGASGPFCFGGARLIDLVSLASPLGIPFRHVDVEGADGYGTRLLHEDLAGAPADRPPLLAWTIDGAPLSRERGLVRLIVATETDDALQQVKWISRVVVSPE